MRNVYTFPLPDFETVPPKNEIPGAEAEGGV